MDKGPVDMSKIEPRTHPKKGQSSSKSVSSGGAGGFYGKYPIHQLMQRGVLV